MWLCVANWWLENGTYRVRFFFVAAETKRWITWHFQVSNEKKPGVLLYKGDYIYYPLIWGLRWAGIEDPYLSTTSIMLIDLPEIVWAAPTWRHSGPSMCWNNVKWPNDGSKLSLALYLVGFTPFLRLRKWWKRTDMHRTRIGSFRRIFCFHDLMSYVTYGRIDLKATCHYLGSHGGLICISWCKEQLERVSDILGFSLVRNDLDCSVFRFN